ncbi:MAG TPA: hypothetical protein VGU26_04725 [Gaiellaceae bacterium]|nr:hypothetical protein [Gaiellaceae bacterium]
MRPSATIAAGALAFALAAAVAAAAPRLGDTSLAPKPGLYRGKTSQSWKVTLRVAASGRKITLFASSVTVYCQASGDYTENRPFLPGGAPAIRSGGRFSHRFSRQDGTVYKYSGRFVSAGKAVGTLTMSSVKIVFGGTEVCVTPGTVRWTATRR